MKLYQVHSEERVKNVDAMSFCRLQVSKKFAKTANAWELLLIDWIVSNLDHRTLHGGAEAMSRVVARVRSEVDIVNARETDPERKLVIIFVPMTQERTGSIRIERQGARHQSLLIPITDTMGTVAL